MSVPPFTDVALLKEFMFAGKAKLTIRSEKTGTHYTYKIRKDKDSDTWWVHRLSGQSAYVYLGTIFGGERFKATRRTAGIYKTCPSFKAFEWFYRRLIDDNEIPPNLTVYHEGKCGMCGRELTDPVSVAEGYGPECRRTRLRRGIINDKTPA
jgi:hypothetical protein